MNRFLRNVVAILLTLAFVLGAAACGKPSVPAGSGQPAASGQPAQQPPLKVGLILPLSGTYATLGESNLRGIDMYLKSVNYTVAGRKIELTKEDDENKPDVGLQKARKLVEQDRVDVIMGLVASSVALAVRDYIDQHKVPTIVTTAISNQLTRSRKSDYIYRVTSTSYQQNAPLGEWLPKHGYTKAYLLAADYAAGHEATADFKATFQKNGGQIVGEAYFPLGNNDFAPYLSKVLEAGPQVVAGFYSGSDAVKLVQQADGFGFAQKGIILAGSGFCFSNDQLPGQGKGAIGSLSGMQWTTNLDSPVNKKFVDEYKAQYKTIPDINVVDGYNGAMVLAEALKAAGGNTQDKAAFLKAMGGLKLETPAGPFSFDENHQAVLDIYISKVADVGGTLMNVKADVLPQYKDPGK